MLMNCSEMHSHLHPDFSFYSFPFCNKEDLLSNCDGRHGITVWSGDLDVESRSTVVHGTRGKHTHGAIWA